MSHNSVFALSSVTPPRQVNALNETGGLCADATLEECRKAMTLVSRYIAGDRHMSAVLTPSTKKEGSYTLAFKGSVPNNYGNEAMLQKFYDHLADQTHVRLKKRLLPALKTGDENCTISGLTLPQIIDTANRLADSIDQKEPAGGSYSKPSMRHRLADIQANRHAKETPCEGLSDHKISPSQLKLALRTIGSSIDPHFVGNNEVQLRIPYDKTGEDFSSHVLKKYASQIDAVETDTKDYYHVTLPISHLVGWINAYAAHLQSGPALLLQLAEVNNPHHAATAPKEMLETTLGAMLSNAPGNKILVDDSHLARPQQDIDRVELPSVYTR